MKVHVAVLFAVLALVALIHLSVSSSPASAVSTSTGTASSAQVITTSTTTHEQAPGHGVLASHAAHHHVRSAVVPRRGGRAHSGALTRLPEGLRPPDCPMHAAGWGRSSDRLVDRAVTTHPLRL
jgi:hypothetical protein